MKKNNTLYPYKAFEIDTVKLMLMCLLFGVCFFLLGLATRHYIWLNSVGI